MESILPNKVSSMGRRNQTLDVIKLFAAYLVVFIHVPFYGTFGKIVTAFARIAVPIFFMTSGYFCYEENAKTIQRRAKRIIVILLLASVLYNLCNIAFAFVHNRTAGIIDYLMIYTDIGRWLRLILLNVPFSATRLWFLLALVYVYFLQSFINKLHLSYRCIFVISACCFVLHILIGNSSLLFGLETPDYICRNFLLFGYPFWGLGLLFRHYESRIVDVDNKLLILLAVLGALLSFLTLSNNTNAQSGIGTVLLVLVVFCISLKAAHVQHSVCLQRLSACSLGIYIIHRPVTSVLSKILSVLGLSAHAIVFNTLLPLSVCVVSTVAVLLLKIIRIERFFRRSRC